MKRKIRGAILAASLALLCGCLNVNLRPHADANMGPYYCTRTMADAVADAFRPSCGITRQMAIAFSPLTITDLPFEAIADTVMLPWDLIASD